MSQQTPYGGPAAPPPYPAPGGPQPGFPAPGQPQRTNTMAILGLVFAFVFSPLGIVFSAMGLSQTRKRGEGGRGLAVAGLVLSIVFLLIGIAVVALAFVAAEEYAENPGAAAELFEDPATGSGAGDLEGVATACDVIMPAMAALEADMATVTTPEDYATVIGTLRDTIEAAAGASGDAMFAEDVQALSDNLGLASDAVVNGEDPTYLENALAADGAQVGSTCGLAGWTE